MTQMTTDLDPARRSPNWAKESTAAAWPRYARAVMPTDSQRGDPHRAEAAQLYARFSEGLLAFFRAALPIAKDDAMDLLQQTFMELLQWRKNGPDRTIQYPRAFLFTIARRRLAAYRDKQRRIPDEPQSTEPALDARAHDDDLEYLSALHDGHRGVLRAMRRMEDRDQQIMLYLRFWEGLSEEAMAQVFGRSRGAVARQLRRARNAVEARLADLGQTEPGMAQTSTTVLERWWHQVEAQAHDLGEDGENEHENEHQDQNHEGGSR